MVPVFGGFEPWDCGPPSAEREPLSHSWLRPSRADIRYANITLIGRAVGRFSSGGAIRTDFIQARREGDVRAANISPPEA